MSKGPGKWQRIILEAVTTNDWCIVEDLLPQGAKRAEHSAINRAAHLLEGAGRVMCAYRTCSRHGSGMHVGRWVLVAYRPGTEMPLCYFGEWMPRRFAMAIHQAPTHEASQKAREEWEAYKCGSNTMMVQPPHLVSNVEDVLTATILPHLPEVIDLVAQP